MTLRPTDGVSTHYRERTQGRLTLGPEGDADGVGEDVYASENGSAAVIRELDLLVRATSERGLCGLCGGTAEGRRRGLGEVVHCGRWVERRRRRR